jgi:hypothetical protein
VCFEGQQLLLREATAPTVVDIAAIGEVESRELNRLWGRGRIMLGDALARPQETSLRAPSAQARRRRRGHRDGSQVGRDDVLREFGGAMFRLHAAPRSDWRSHEERRCSRAPAGRLRVEQRAHVFDGQSAPPQASSAYSSSSTMAASAAMESASFWTPRYST